MAKRECNYSLGNIISVVDDEGIQIALCRIEAMDGKGTAIGRFFINGDLNDESAISLEGAGFLWKFGDLSILSGKWPIVGIQAREICEDASVFHFIGGRETGRPWVSTYDIFAKKVDEKVLSEKHIEGLPKDSLRGAGFVEARLKQIISGERSPFD